MIIVRKVKHRTANFGGVNLEDLGIDDDYLNDLKNFKARKVNIPPPPKYDIPPLPNFETPSYRAAQLLFLAGLVGAASVGVQAFQYIRKRKSKKGKTIVERARRRQ